MLLCDLGKVIPFSHHIDSGGRISAGNFLEIFLEGIAFPLGNFNLIVTPGKIEPTDLRVEFLYDPEIAFRGLSDDFEGSGSFDFEIDDIVENRFVVLIFFQGKSEFLRP